MSQPLYRRPWVWATVLTCTAAAAAICYVGYGTPEPTWRAPLQYPNREAGTLTDPDAFTSAKVCAACHEQHYAEWRRSAMSQSSGLSQFLIDLYEASLDIRGAPLEDVAQCLHCHAPIAVMGPEPDLGLARELSREGVTCDVCHTVTEAHANDAPGMLRWDPKGPKRGPLPGQHDEPVAGVVRSVSPYHETAHSPVIQSAELCGACHMSLWPTNALPIDWTYAEWKRSPWGKNGVTCQSCHMQTYEGQAAPGSPTRTLHRHDFPGGTQLDFVRGAANIELSAESHFSGHEVSVRVENSGAGHAFPTGDATAPVVRLIVVARDEAGTQVFEGTREYRLTYVDGEGNVTSDPSTAVAVKSDTTLQPTEPRHERFFLAKHLGAAQVEARLMYSRWNEDITNNHAGLVLEFVGRYLEQGFRPHRLLARIPDLDYATLDQVRGEPMQVAEDELELPPPPTPPEYLNGLDGG